MVRLFDKFFKDRKAREGLVNLARCFGYKVGWSCFDDLAGIIDKYEECTFCGALVNEKKLRYRDDNGVAACLRCQREMTEDEVVKIDKQP